MSGLTEKSTDQAWGGDTRGERTVRIRTILQIAFWLAVAGTLAPAQALTQQELVTKLEAAGYSHVGEMKSTAEGIVVKATKDGKEVNLVVDSSGQIKRRD